MANPFKIKMPPNMLGKDYVIGDLHGDYDSLMRLLDFVDFSKAYDRLFCVGDLIHRGPKSNECLTLLDERRYNGERWFFSTVGNHDVFEDQDIPQFRKYMVNHVPYEQDLKQMPFMYEVEHPIFGHYWITHGELNSAMLFGNNTPIKKINKDLNSDVNLYTNVTNVNSVIKGSPEIDPILENDMTYAIKEILLDNNWLPSDDMQFQSIWSRQIFTSFVHNYNKNIMNGDFSFLNHFKDRANKLKIFCGHSLVPFPMVIGNQIYCDTGACFGYDDSSEQILKGFSLWGSQFFGLTIIDINMGIAHTCVSSEKSLMLPDNHDNQIQYKRGDVVTLQQPLYKNIFEY